MINDEDEKWLVVRVQNGDIAAFEKLLRLLYKPLRSYVTRIVGESTVDDVLQEISLKIYQKIKFLREPAAFRPWIYRIATRIALVHLRREQKWRPRDADGDKFKAVSAITLPSHEEVASELLSKVDRVSPASRVVLLLHYQQNLSLEETAAILDVPLGTVKSRLSYGIATLRSFFKEKENK
jgi:RNA polymerase sigma-70 factor (ECF subfamily)